MVQPQNIQQEAAQNKSSKPYHQMQYRWVMLALISALYASHSLVASAIAPLVTPIMADLGISYSQIGFIMGSWQLSYIAMAMIGGTLIDRWGIRRSIFLGILVVGLSAILRYFVNGFTTLFLCVALFGVGGPMMSIGAPKTIAEWFAGKDRATAIGIYMTATQIGGLIAFSAINSVIMPLSGMSWRLTFIFIGLPAIIFTFAWVFFAKETKTQVTTEKTSMLKVFTNIIRLHNVRLILIIGFLSMVIGHGFRNWLPNILENGGLSPTIAGYAASIPQIVGIPVLLFAGRFIAPHLRGKYLAWTSIISAVLLVAIVITSGTLLIMSLALWGLVTALRNPLTMLILIDSPEIGAKNMGAAGGLYFCISEIGGFSGPTIIGIIKGMSGSFTTASAFLAVLSVIMGILAFLLRFKNTSKGNT